MPYKDKCFSTCKEFEKEECNPPRCKYIGGPTLKYCRISHKYKMNKPKCNVTRRIKKSEQKAYATKKIGDMIKRSGKFLQTICSNSGVCIAFGKHTGEITNFFKGFDDFTYALSPIKQIGKTSANGFVKEIAYEKQGYKAHAIFKSAKTAKSDNLVYEYLVGIKYINRIMKLFPCFLETYGLYFYSGEPDWKIMSNSGPVHAANLKRLQLQSEINYSKACKESKYAAILIQHIHDSKPLVDYTGTSKYNKFMKSDMLYVLFIIYHALAAISKNFSHYDLHDANVLIYEPEKGKYIQYHYHHEDGTETVFYSPYLPKIIDYGRSFFDNGNLTSRKIYDKICSVSDCEPDCGSEYGMAWLDPIPEITISSSQKNESHDLRLLKLISSDMEKLLNIHHIEPTEATFVETKKVLKKVVYGVSLPKDEKSYGTKENLNISPTKIYNVNGAYLALKSAIQKPKVLEENQRNYNKFSNLLGSFHIYDDGRAMKYEAM